MAGISLSQLALELDTGIRTSLSSFDIDSLPLHERELITLIKRQASDARLDVRDYEYAQTRTEQLQGLPESSERFGQLEKNIVKASEYNLFGAVDVVQLSTKIQQILARMN